MPLLLTFFFGAAHRTDRLCRSRTADETAWNTGRHHRRLVVTYIQITCGLIIVQVGYNAVASVLQAIGDSKTPLYFLILCSFLNILRGPVLCIGAGDGGCRGSLGDHHFPGNCRPCCLLCICGENTQCCGFGRQEMVLDKKIMGDYLRYGLPMGLTSCLLSVGMLVITSVINSFGSSVCRGLYSREQGGKYRGPAVSTSLRCHFPSTPVRILAQGTGTGSILGSARQCGWSSSCRSLRRC